jgi:hypothetical protein
MYLFYYSQKWSSQPSNISKTGVEFKIVMLKSDHKYLIWSIAHEFKIVMLEAGHKYSLYDITIEFKSVMLAIDHKFHINFFFYH